MDFETRLETLHESRKAPVYETDAAVNVYERMVTAKAICETVYGAGYSADAVASVMSELSAEARFIMLNDERLAAEGAED
jgi:hypothetical protein